MELPINTERMVIMILKEKNYFHISSQLWVRQYPKVISMEMVLRTYTLGELQDKVEIAIRRAFLSRLREGRPQAQAYEVKVESTLDDLAAHLAAHCDLDALLAIAERGV